jgi:hypothetical protein
MKKTFWIVLASAAVALGAAGCSGGGGSQSTGTTTTSGQVTTPTSSQVVTTPTAPPTTSGGKVSGTMWETTALDQAQSELEQLASTHTCLDSPHSSCPTGNNGYIPHCMQPYLTREYGSPQEFQNEIDSAVWNPDMVVSKAWATVEDLWTNCGY